MKFLSAPSSNFGCNGGAAAAAGVGAGAGAGATVGATAGSRAGGAGANFFISLVIGSDVRHFFHPGPVPP